MFDFIKGNVTEITKDSIVLEANNVGFRIMSPSPYGYTLGNEYIVYTYMHVKDEVFSLYGFITKEERNLFLKLISVSGIGPKSAIAIIATGSVGMIVQAINRGDAKYLCKFPGIGTKSAQQIILDLKGKVTSESYSGNYLVLEEVRDALNVLGYNEKDIQKVLPQLNTSKSTSELIKDALALILK